MGAILEGCDRRDLGEAVDVEGRAHAVEPAHDLGRSHDIANAQAGERGDLGERAERDQPWPASRQRHPVGGLRVIGEVPVRLVEDHERAVVAELLQELVEGASPDDRRSGIVRRAQEDGLGLGPHAREHGVEIGIVPAERDLHRRGSGQARLGMRISSPGSKAARAISPSSSSPPLPAISQSGGTPSHEPRASRSRVEPPSG